MKRSYLEVTFRKGKPLAAYLYLPRRSDDRATRTEKVNSDFNIDFAADGRPIGVEILAPQAAKLAAVNAVLGKLQIAPLDAADLAPLAAA
jgi:hypothetical protein